jgi:murein DD-endopeptidase MepM/ murein hydrolase activator NlpD
MSSNLPLWGKGREEEDAGLTLGERNHETVRSETNEAAPRSTRKSKSRSRAQQSINDAQQGLHSLLKPQTGDGHPHIISPSGATRNQLRGRIAGPTADLTPGSTPSADNGSHLLRDGDALDSSLAIVPGNSRTSLTARQAKPTSRLSLGASRAVQSLQRARDQANLLIVPLDDASSDVGLAAMHKSRRAASQWVTRYATHLVILLVVGVLVALGGLKTLTVQGAFPNGMHAADLYTGTDLTDGDQANNGADGQDYTITLPRTELDTGAAVANNSVNQAPGTAPQAATGNAVQYTVAQGDTIESIAAKYKLLPETVMGSNGIYDPEEQLTSGRVLVIPPIDAMYYVVAQGDTLDSIAQRFQVEPDVIASYQVNNISNGAVQPGQAILVPGGMMPPREATISYTVRPGDSLRDIAARFGVDVPTMLNSNNIPDPDNLQIGSQLSVLPVPGVEYKVRKGDNLNTIADRFGVSPQMILDYPPNHLTVDSALKIDQVLMVPGGSPQEQVVAAARLEPVARGPERPPERQPQQPAPAPAKPTPKPQAKAAPAAAASTNNSPKSGTGRFMWPVNGVITQYFTRRHNGLDIAIRAGTPIHAADSGRVIWAGWRTDGLGYCVMIDHLNGYTTVYGHMIRQPPVYVGQYVSRGQVIGYIGSTGHSTGPHVHFLIKVGGGTSHVYRNPLAYLGGR